MVSIMVSMYCKQYFSLKMSEQLSHTTPDPSWHGNVPCRQASVNSRAVAAANTPQHVPPQRQNHCSQSVTQSHNERYTYPAISPQPSAQTTSQSAHRYFVLLAMISCWNFCPTPYWGRNIRRQSLYANKPRVTRPGSTAPVGHAFRQ